MRLKHGARWRAELTSVEDGALVDSNEGEVGADEIIGKDYYALIYNAAGVAGGVLWRHPTRETLYPAGLQYRLVVPVDPADELAEGELRDCGRCLAENHPMRRVGGMA